MDEIDELVTFLLGQLDEDEAAAKAMLDGVPEQYVPSYIRDVHQWFEFNSPQTREHYGRHDPARVLREVEAKRQIITYYQGLRMDHSSDEYVVRAMWWVVWQLAKPYSDHPDYREEWKP